MPAEAAKPEGTLTVAVATFGNERWLPQLHVGAEDIVLKPPWEWPGINGHTGLDNWST